MTSKDPSQWDGSTEHPKHKIKSMSIHSVKTYLKLRCIVCLSKPAGCTPYKMALQISCGGINGFILSGAVKLSIAHIYQENCKCCKRFIMAKYVRDFVH